MNITEFKNSIKTKNVEDNKTYLYTTINGCKYGQSYQNTVNTIEGMKNSFVMTYYRLYELEQRLGDYKMVDIFTGKVVTK